MMDVETYRFKITGAMGQNPRTVERDATYLNESGFRASLSPELLCDELTADVRNGTNPLDATDTGLQLGSLDTVQVLVSDGQTETPIFFGDVRTGGNTRNPDLEGISLRGFDQRLREVGLDNVVYSRQDVARLVDQVILALAESGQMGAPTVTFPVSGIPHIVTASGFRYDGGLQPALGITLEITDPQGGLVGDLLDKIVQAAFEVNPAQPLTWGVKPDGFFWFGLKRTDVLTLSKSDLSGEPTWPAPVATAPVTVVQWLIQRRGQKGLYKIYRSRSPLADVYGDRVKTLTLEPTDTVIWTDVPYIIQDSLPVFTEASKPEIISRLTDDDLTTQVALRTAVNGPPTFMLVQGQALFDRVVVQVYSAPGSVLQLSSQNADGSASSVFFTSGPGDKLSDAIVPYQDPVSGSAVRVQATAPNSGDAAGMILYTLRLQVLNRALLDARAAYHFKTPAIDPTDAELNGFLPPGDFRGRLNLTDIGYERAVEKFEYRMSAEGGLATGILTGQADDPEVLAKADLIKASIANGVVIAVKSS